MITKGQALYEGKAKIIYSTPNADQLITYFKDDATAFNGAKKGQITEKGVVNAAMSAMLFELLEKRGVPTHFISKVSDRELLVKKVQIILIEVVVRNLAAGSICKRLGLNKGAVLGSPLVEFFYKNDALGDPLITDDHVEILKLATPKEVQILKTMALKVNGLLLETLQVAGLKLVDFKLEFGRLADGSIVLADEISPDTCRLWDVKTGEVLDKDRFRHDMGNVESAYKEVLKRVGANI